MHRRLVIATLFLACNANQEPAAVFVAAYNDYATAVCGCHHRLGLEIWELGKGPYTDESTCLSDLKIDEVEASCLARGPSFDPAYSCLAKRFEARLDCITSACTIELPCELPKCDDLPDFAHDMNLNECLSTEPRPWD